MNLKFMLILKLKVCTNIAGISIILSFFIFLYLKPGKWPGPPLGHPCPRGGRAGLARPSLSLGRARPRVARRERVSRWIGLVVTFLLFRKSSKARFELPSPSQGSVRVYSLSRHYPAGVSAETSTSLIVLPKLHPDF